MPPARGKKRGAATSKKPGSGKGTRRAGAAGSQSEARTSAAEIDQDEVSVMVKGAWLSGKPKYDAELVRRLFVERLARPESHSRDVMLLELNQYLEKYLWPFFDEDESSDEHVLSIVMLVNEKVRQNIKPWLVFGTGREEPRQAFSSMLWRVWDYTNSVCDPEYCQAQCKKIGMSRTDLKATLVQFLINMFQSLETDIVRAECLEITSLGTWHCLLDVKRAVKEFEALPQIKKYWKYLEKSFKKLDESVQKRVVVKRTLLSKLIVDFLSELYSAGSSITYNNNSKGTDAAAQVPSGIIRYCELFIGLLIDLESQLPTRRYFNVLLEDHQVVLLMHNAPCLNKGGDAWAKTKQLAEMLSFYHSFPIADVTGAPLSEDQTTRTLYNRLIKLQKLAFVHLKDSLEDLAMASVSQLKSSDRLRHHLESLDEAGLEQLCMILGFRLAPMFRHPALPTNEAGRYTRQFLVKVITSHFEARRSQAEFINRLPLYPDESLIFSDILKNSTDFNEDSLLSGLAGQKEAIMPIPKLNLQFLTLQDYLLRNFTLYRLESAYEVRQDLEDVVKRLSPRVAEDPETGLGVSGIEGTEFAGWSRMATPIKSFEIIDVKRPRIGQAHPSLVRADVTISLANYVDSIREEWDREVRPRDVLFLASVQADYLAEAPETHGVRYLRGCEVEYLIGPDGKPVDEFGWLNMTEEERKKRARASTRTYRVILDPSKYAYDTQPHNSERPGDVYASLNVLMRRRALENNFKAVLETIRGLLQAPLALPGWLHDVFLGYGDPRSAHHSRLTGKISRINFRDTFLNLGHLRESFSGYTVKLAEGEDEESIGEPFIVEFPDDDEDSATAAARPKSKGRQLVVSHVRRPNMGPYPFNKPKLNVIRFTPAQVDAIRSASNPGLTMIVGPPGTGKTDVAVQIVANLYHNFSNQHTLLITHSNQALNQIFEKIMQLDIDQRHLLRLGHGEQELNTEERFTRAGRVNSFLERRIYLLGEVERLARSLKIPGDVGYTCETAGYFYVSQVLVRWEPYRKKIEIAADSPRFEVGCSEDEVADMRKTIVNEFPFHEYFANAPQPLFPEDASCFELADVAMGCFRHIHSVFTELDEIRPFELLRTNADRSNYLLTNEAKIVAMTCTHAAMRRNELIRLGFKYDNVVMEEAAQLLEIETFIPLTLQANESSDLERSAASLGGRHESVRSRLKRLVMIGDHNQLPPVVKHPGFQKYGNMEQSLFSRLIRLGVPYIELDRQGRARSSIASLYRWRYDKLEDLPLVKEQTEYLLANPGFAFDYQLVDVGDFQGKGESEPVRYFYQNLGEAEYVVAVYQYMRLLGYPAEKITILTTYNGQKALIRDVLRQRCSWNPIFGSPAEVTTVDQYQGRQNDYVLLSLVRTKHIGHIRDVRRLVVAMSRARLGLYVFCRKSLFENCYELQPVFKQLLARPDRLRLVADEAYPTERKLDDEVEAERLVDVDGLEAMGKLVYEKAQTLVPDESCDETEEIVEERMQQEGQDMDAMEIDYEEDESDGDGGDTGEGGGEDNDEIQKNET